MKLIKKIIGLKVFKLSLVILLQLIGVFAFANFASHRTAIYNLAILINICISISLLSKDDLNPVYKIMWILILSGLPVVGTVIYLMWGDRKITKKKAEKIYHIEEEGKKALLDFPFKTPPEMLSGGEKASAKYLETYAGAPVFDSTEAEYFPNGETFFTRLLEELEKAEKYIFMEYFIIKEGYMWDKIHEILKRKAECGVEIRLIYDAMGSLFDLPENFKENMQKDGIKCSRFNPLKFYFKPTEYTFINHRDHRKICVIDGNVGFTGGINISDEYINRRTNCGYWKDTAVMLKGYGVFSLTVTFLKMWSFVTKENNTDFSDFVSTIPADSDFYVQPYDDSPIDIENVSENSYFNVIYHARKYVYITTPYLIIDNEMITALSLAAKSGVDVKIILPGIPDKKYVYYLTQSYYPELLKAGVKIYEYKPGFIHAKMFVRDNEQAIVGTANMDYRSLYLHFENCCSFYGGHIVTEVKEDIEKMLPDCRLITKEEIIKTPKFKRLLQLILKFFAPLM